MRNCEDYYNRFSNPVLVDSLVRECRLILSRDCGFVNLNPPYEMRDWDPHKSLNSELKISLLSQSQMDSKSMIATSQQEGSILSLPAAVCETLFIHL